MRLRVSSGMGLNHGGLLGVGLLLSTALAHTPCSSCSQSWLLLASDLQATAMVVLSAFLFKPVQPSSAGGLIMQVSHITLYLHSTAATKAGCFCSSGHAQAHTILSLPAGTHTWFYAPLHFLSAH